MILLFFLICLYDIGGKEENRDFWYRFVLFIFIAIAGLRYRIGGDTINYLEIFYHDTPILSSLSYEDVFSSSMEPLYVLMTSVVKTIGGKYFWIQFIQAFIVNVLIFKYFKRHSDCIFTCIFIYALWAYTLFNFEEMRAAISISLCLFANDYFLERKWLKGFFLYLIGCLFHYSTILLLITPLFLFLKLNLVGVLILCLAIPVADIAEDAFGNYLLLIDMDGQISGKAIGYINNDEFHGRHNILYYLIDIGIYVFYFLISYLYVKGRNVGKDLLSFQPFLIIGTAFFLAKSNFEILTRFAHFYYPYFIMFISLMFVDLVKNNLIQMQSLAWIRSLFFFLPFFYMLIWTYIASPPRMLSKSYHNYQKYYPYSSIIEKDINEERENLFRNLYSVNLRHSHPEIEEY